MSNYTTHSIIHYSHPEFLAPKRRCGHPAGHPKPMQLETPLFPLCKERTENLLHLSTTVNSLYICLTIGCKLQLAAAAMLS